jgi:hypothetical protein
VFVINSGAHVTKGACNFYELLGCRLLIQRTMLLHARRTKRDNRGIKSGYTKLIELNSLDLLLLV